MATVFVRIKWTNYDEVIEVFANHADVRQSYGSQGATVFRNAEDPDEAMILFEWDDPANMKAFFDDPEVQAVIRPGAVAPPQVFVASGAEDFNA